MMNRRDFYRYGTIVLGNLDGAWRWPCPGVAYVLDPLLQEGRRRGDFQHAGPAQRAEGRACRRRSRSSTSGRTPG